MSRHGLGITLCALAVVVVASCDGGGSGGGDGGIDGGTDSDSVTDTGSDTETDPCGSEVWSGGFSVQYPAHLEQLGGYTHVTGELVISSDTIASLAGLESLRCIGGSLTVEENLALPSRSSTNVSSSPWNTMPKSSFLSG